MQNTKKIGRAAAANNIKYNGSKRVLIQVIKSTKATGRRISKSPAFGLRFEIIQFFHKSILNLSNDMLILTELKQK